MNQMTAKATIEHGTKPCEWLVNWSTTEDAQGQFMNLRMNVSFVHPSPRISDLERATLEQTISILQGMLDVMPHRQDK